MKKNGNIGRRIIFTLKQHCSFHYFNFWVFLKLRLKRYAMHKFYPIKKKDLQLSRNGTVGEVRVKVADSTANIFSHFIFIELKK